MSAAAGTRTSGTVGRLALTVVGVLLMLAPPYALVFTRLTTSLQSAIIAGVELVSVVAGFLLLYFGSKQPAQSD